MTPNLHDPEDFAKWVAALKEALHDLCAAAQDQIAPLNDRRLGRATARKIIHDSCDKAEALLALANSPTIAPPPNTTD